MPFHTGGENPDSHATSAGAFAMEEASKVESQNQNTCNASDPAENDKGRVRRIESHHFRFDEDEVFTFGEEDTAPESAEPPSKRRRTKLSRRPYERDRLEDDHGPFRALVFFVIVWLGLSAGITATFLSQPDRAQALLASVPLIGHGIAEERLWARRVRLEGVEASTRATGDGRPVLVISGRVVNTSLSPLQAVQLGAEIMNARGYVIDKKTVFAGNVMSIHVLRDLTPQEISILQQLSPPKQFAIPPGESASFAVAFFLDPTKTDEGKRPSEFRLRVIAARRQG